MSADPTLDAALSLCRRVKAGKTSKFYIREALEGRGDSRIARWARRGELTQEAKRLLMEAAQDDSAEIEVVWVDPVKPSPPDLTQWTFEIPIEREP